MKKAKVKKAPRIKPRDGRWNLFKHNLNAYPGFLQRFDDLGCYYWLRMKSLIWSGFVIGMLLTVIFLPVRLLFYTYVSPNWLGNLGLLSLIAGMIFLVVHTQRGKKNLLGKFSLVYRQRMSRLVHNKHSLKSFIIGQCIMAMIYFTLFYTSTETIVVDKTPEINEFNMSIGYNVFPINSSEDANVFDNLKNTDMNKINDEETQKIIASNVNNLMISGAFSLESKEQMYNYYKNSRHTDSKFTMEDNDLLGEILEAYATLPRNTNTYTAGWSSHFVAVWLITDVEYTILFFAYRTVYTKMDVGLPFKAIDAWKSSRGGFLNPNIKELKAVVN